MNLDQNVQNIVLINDSKNRFAYQNSKAISEFSDDMLQEARLIIYIIFSQKIVVNHNFEIAKMLILFVVQFPP